MSLFEPPPTHGPERSGWPSGNRGTGRFAMSGVASGVNSPESFAGRRPESCCCGEDSCAISVSVNATTATDAISTCLTVTPPLARSTFQSSTFYVYFPLSTSDLLFHFSTFKLFHLSRMRSYTPMPRTTKSQRLFARAVDVLPGGVDSPVRCLLYTSDAADERSSVDLG